MGRRYRDEQWDPRSEARERRERPPARVDATFRGIIFGRDDGTADVLILTDREARLLGDVLGEAKEQRSQACGAAAGDESEQGHLKMEMGMLQAIRSYLANGRRGAHEPVRIAAYRDARAAEWLRRMRERGEDE